MDDVRLEIRNARLESRFAAFIGVPAEAVELSLWVHRAGGEVAHTISVDGDARVAIREWLARGGQEAMRCTGIRLEVYGYDQVCDSTLVLLQNRETDERERQWAEQRGEYAH